MKREPNLCRFCRKDLPSPEPVAGTPRFTSRAEYDAWKGEGGSSGTERLVGIG
jgi:hypothetical protein